MAFVLLSFAEIQCVWGQTFNFDQERWPIADLQGPMRFHIGDDSEGKLGWADPMFDDSSWELRSSEQQWSDHGPGGFAWFRCQVVLPPDHPPMALQLYTQILSYKVFAEGHLIGQVGGFPPRPQVIVRNSQTDAIIPIPDSLLGHHTKLRIAIRAWYWPYWRFSYPPFTLRIGAARTVEEQRTFVNDAFFRDRSVLRFMLIGYLLASMAGFGLFLLRRSEFEYLWFAGAELGNAGQMLYGLWAAPPFHAFQLFNALSILTVFICWPNFIVSLLKTHRGRLFWTTMAASTLVGVMFVPLLFHWVSMDRWVVLIFSSVLPYMLCTLLLLLIPARRGMLDARLLLVPEILVDGARLGQGMLYIFLATGNMAMFHALSRRYVDFVSWPVKMSVQQVADLLSQVAILAILLLRFARTRRDEERMKGEFEAARAVQQVLVPSENPSIPGFAIESVYRPASQVGGDFFQIIATPVGDALAVIGDVSGKGMPAAMTVSLLVGTFRTLAHYTESPGDILSAMNRRMLARSQGGFTTCLVLRAACDGSLTIANAGHIPPNVDGHELTMEGSLPLGLVENAKYPETNVNLPGGAQLTLLTDGIVEARNRSGQLFGFTRLQMISRQSAAQIAEAAQAFGQEDDITVLTLSRAAGLQSVGHAL